MKHLLQLHNLLIQNDMSGSVDNGIPTIDTTSLVSRLKEDEAVVAEAVAEEAVEEAVVAEAVVIEAEAEAEAAEASDDSEKAAE